MDHSGLIEFHTFGCKVNTYDTGILESQVKHLNPQKKLHVLNTCAVTGEATAQALRLVRKLKRDHPESLVVVTGCSAQVDTEKFLQASGVDLIVANSHKERFGELLGDLIQGKSLERSYKSNIFKKTDLGMGGGIESHHTRSFLKIQDGCNSFCSFCIIPYARGKSQSLPIEHLVERAESLSSPELVLTGVHIGDYEDHGRGLEDLIEEILLKTKTQRIRLSSLEPIEVSDRLLELYQDPRLCAHFHMSIQSANTDVLRQMKRKYGQKEVLDSLNKIYRKVNPVFIGLDVIAGFPTETEEQFLDSYRALCEAPWTRIHVFPFSERQGTQALSLGPGVPLEIRHHRARRLREMSLSRWHSEALRQVGTEKRILVLQKASRGLQGLSRDYWPLKLDVEPKILETLKGQELLGHVDSFRSPRRAGEEGFLVAQLKGFSAETSREFSL